MARELMAITGLTAQALVHLARSAFGAVGGAASACLSAASAASLGIFLSDGVTGDVRGLNLLGNRPPTPVNVHTHTQVKPCTFVRCTFVHSYMHTFIQWCICTFIRSGNRLCTHLYICTFVNGYNQSFIHSCICRVCDTVVRLRRGFGHGPGTHGHHRSHC